MYMYICMYVYMYTCTYVYMHTCMYSYMYMSICVYGCVCAPPQRHTLCKKSCICKLLWERIKLSMHPRWGAERPEALQWAQGGDTLSFSSHPLVMKLWVVIPHACKHLV